MHYIYNQKIKFAKKSIKNFIFIIHKLSEETQLI